jgi:hypothetical protein
MKEYKVVPGFYTAGTYVAGMHLEAAPMAIQGRVEDKAAFIKSLHEAQLDNCPIGATAPRTWPCRRWSSCSDWLRWCHARGCT